MTDLTTKVYGDVTFEEGDPDERRTGFDMGPARALVARLLDQPEGTKARLEVPTGTINPEDMKTTPRNGGVPKPHPARGRGSIEYHEARYIRMAANEKGKGAHITVKHLGTGMTMFTVSLGTKRPAPHKAVVTPSAAPVAPSAPAKAAAAKQPPATAK